MMSAVRITPTPERKASAHRQDLGFTVGMAYGIRPINLDAS